MLEHVGVVVETVGVREDGQRALLSLVARVASADGVRTFGMSRPSALMYGLRSIQAPVLHSFALSSGQHSIATSGAVPLLMARSISSACFPGTTFTVIHGNF
jgi:hypothetical protein